MKEQLYTIPLNDAINANDECPFCFIERNVEQDLLDFVLGSGSSYMESDIREATDKAGFCRSHFKKMFDYGNTLGNGWILKTHFLHMNKQMHDQFRSFVPQKTPLMGKLKKNAAQFSRAASGNGFSKYSGKVVSAVRNRARFAIRAHCALLVTSVSPNCCFKNGILRKSHFPAPSSFETTARCLCLPPSLPAPSQLFRPSWLSSVVLIFI